MKWILMIIFCLLIAGYGFSQVIDVHDHLGRYNPRKIIESLEKGTLSAETNLEKLPNIKPRFVQTVKDGDVKYWLFYYQSKNEGVYLYAKNESLFAARVRHKKSEKWFFVEMNDLARFISLSKK